MAQEGKVTVPVRPEPWKEGDRDVPAVLGHDEGQPAYGVAVKTWRDGDKLKADLVNIPKEVSDAIKAGAYFQTSAEVYDDTGEAGLPAGGGCMLRRIALLGADIPQVKTLADLPKPDDAGTLKGVEIFAVGNHRGQEYREADLDNMVKNFQRYSAPAVKFSVGQQRHKVTMVRKFTTGPRGGEYHVTDSGAKVYESIAKKHLGGRSLETQGSDEHDFKPHHVAAVKDAVTAAYVAGGGKEGSEGHKAALSKAAQSLRIKTLETKAGGNDRDNIQEHSSWQLKEALSNAHAAGSGDSAKKHSDEVNMDRSRIIDALVMAGMDKGVAEAMDDATLQALAPVCDKLSPGSQPPEMMADEPKSEDDAAPAADAVPDAIQPPAADVSTPVPDEAAPDAPEFDRTAMVAQLVGAGLDANELNALSDDDLKKRLEQVNAVAKNADSMDGQGETPDDPAMAPGPQADGSEAPIQKLACAGAKKMSSKKYAEQQVSALHDRLAKTKEEMDKALAQSAADLKAAKFETFKEKLRAGGKLVPAMEEGGLLDDFVKTLDHSTVRKFGEGKKTQFDMIQEILDRLPRVVKYGETLKSSTPGVIKHAESVSVDQGEQGIRARYRQFSEKFKKMGYTEDEAVKAFNLRKAKNPLLTADDYLKV